MRNTNKKGFTIVELVIVIAVIAILAAVLIPTFSSIIKKANLSADQKAERDMNTALAIEQYPDNFDAVIDALVASGFNKEHLIPVSEGYAFAWNSATKKIELVEGTLPAGYSNLKDLVKYIDVAAKTADDIVNAFATGSEYIKLDADITISKPSLEINNANVTFDLNGHTLTTVQSSGKSTVVYINEGASLTVTNGTLNVRSLQNYGDLTIKSDVVINAMDITGGGCIKNKTGNVVIEGGTFNVVNYTDWDTSDKGGACAVENVGGTVTIKGGTFNTVTAQYLICNLAGTTTIEGGEFTAFRGALDCEGGKLIVNNGKFTVTNDAQGGWIAYTEGDGEIVLNGGEYSSVTDRDFWGNVTGAKAN